ncbi:MAG TPA: sigma 54-interacting transcriptional regulator [Pyrinomonadaceae bacterium]|nr:sigma 54-interacting transcriptional regulator [Pyrinomonadaceae bacterium]
MKRSPLIKRGPRAAAPGIAKERREVPSREDLDALFSSIGQKLREGLSSEAERIVVDAIAAYGHTDDDLASLKRLHSFTLETVGRYKESLEAIRPYEDRENLDRLGREIRIRVMTQLAIAYNNLGDHPKAVTLLKETLETAKAEELTHLNGQIHIGLARVYRKLNESNICRDHANAALEPLRAAGDWLGLAEAYREIAISYHQEGNSEEALQYFDLGIQIIGDRSAPFMLGKLYTDMSGAYSFLRRPQEGIECLERSITFFDQTEHILNSVIAYNNLGMHLMHVGEWHRAEERIKRALDLAIESNHAHIAGILDSLGEMKILRGDLREARSLLTQAVSAAREHKREWYEAQALRNLSRCLLAEGDNEKAAATARETIELSGRIGDKHYAKMAGLVLAEAMLRLDRTAEFENAIAMVESNDPESDFYVFGSVQRIRGLASAGAGDIEMAVHHFNRSLTIFETANDTYHIAEAHLLLAEYLPPDRSEQAMRHLEAAKDIFKKLGLDERLRNAESVAAARKTLPARTEPARSNSVVSQLLMVRLAEATASRELLFRELMAVLQQETTAKKIVIAEMNDKKRLRPFITHGIAPSDSAELVAQYEKSEHAGTAKAFERSKNFAVLDLKPAGAPAAAVLVSPSASAKLSDGSPLQPLIKVVELGLDVIDLRSRERSRPAEQETGSPASTSVMPGFIHSSPAMTSLVEEIYKIRSSDVTVLVTGESGTGKELVSRAIHTLSNRKDKVFIPFNCTAVPKELAEGHLFGYKRGAFTGAVTDSPGIIRSADGGTLFLDEIGDLPLDVQPKLLRFLQEGEVQPIGEKKPIKVDVRVIAATNMPLEEKVAEGSFREDLYYRLNVIRLRVPPLRERRSEIPPMVNYYIRHYSEKFNKRDVTFTPQTVDLLMVCNWEGNVRQLCNEIQRIVARAEDGDVITPEHLSPELRRSAKPITTFGEPAAEAKPITSFNSPIMPFANLSTGTTLEEAVGELEMQMIKAALSRHNWNISRVANELGLTRRGLYLKLSRYGIEKVA